MNEAQVRERLHKAVGEASYPAYLSSRIEARLKPDAYMGRPPHIQRGGRSPWLASVRRTSSLAAALLVVLLMASFVLGVRVLLMNGRPAPAGQDLTIKQYQAKVHADFVAFEKAPLGSCGTIDDAGCPAAAKVVIATEQHWLDDLSVVQAPVRFSAVDALMHRYLTRVIADHSAMLAAFNAKDRNSFSAALVACGKDKSSLEIEAQDVLTSSQGTTATYISWVQLHGGLLVGKDPVSCRVSPAQGCVGMLTALRVNVETFEGDLARYSAPDSLAANDARLQADLVTAEVALDAMDSALSEGDDLALQAGDEKLRQALVLIQSDVAAIVKAS
jgi:hypothetical protein